MFSVNVISSTFYFILFFSCKSHFYFSLIQNHFFFHNLLTLSADYVGLFCLDIWNIYVVLTHVIVNGIYIPARFISNPCVCVTCIVLWVKEELSSLLHRHQNRTGLLCTPDWLHDQTGKTLFPNPHVLLVNIVREPVCDLQWGWTCVPCTLVSLGLHSSMPQGHEDRLVSKYDILSLGHHLRWLSVCMYLCAYVSQRDW